MDITLSTKTKKFFAYCRESIDLESGIKIQREAISNYVKDKNIEILKWYIDNDSSAYEYRPNYEKMMELLFNPEIECDGVICHTLSRFGRSTSSVLDAKTKLSNNKKELVLLKENLDTTTPQGRLQFGIFALFNDFEHDLILERTQAGIKHAIKNGTKSGKPMHRPPKKVDWKKFDEMKEKDISTPSIAKMFGMTKKTLYNKIKER
jgi:DNA invertase Pin-like site-specific DNA recombinase